MNAVTEAFETRDRTIDGGRIGRETGRREDRERKPLHEAVTRRRSAKKRDSSSPHSSAQTPLATVV